MMRTLLTISLLSMSSLHALSQLESNLPSRHQSSQITQTADGSQTATVSTDTDTPLLNAIHTINEEYGWNVHFEDAPTVNPSEVFDYFPEFHRTHPGFHEELQDGYALKTQPFQSTFNEPDAQNGDVRGVLEKVIHDYNASGNPGKFRLDRTRQGNYVVVGAQYKAESGLEVDYTPIFNCPISVSIPPSSLHDALELVADQVNKTCPNSLHAKLNAEFASFDRGPNGGIAVLGSFQQEAVRDVIENLLDQEPCLTDYAVVYQSGINIFYLGTLLAHKKAIGVDGNEIFEPIMKNPGDDNDAHAR
jgi:hypothetical protein